VLCRGASRRSRIRALVTVVVDLLPLGFSVQLLGADSCESAPTLVASSFLGLLRKPEGDLDLVNRNMRRRPTPTTSERLTPRRSCGAEKEVWLLITLSPTRPATEIEVGASEMLLL
jgi:hypothetical protein